MPHLTLEHTHNLHATVEIKTLFARMHAVLADAGIKQGNCKSRALALDRFYVGDGKSAAAFVHLDVRFLQGRSAETKRNIGRRLLVILRDCYSSPAGVDDLQITVEVRDIDRAMYFKSPEASLE